MTVPDLLALLVGAVVILAQVFVFVALARQNGLLPSKKRRAWSDAVRTVADELGLEPREVAASWDVARGTVADSDVSIGSDTDDDVTFMTIEVFRGSLPELLRIRARGARLPRSESLGERQLTSDPALDARLELAGATPALREALRTDPALRALVTSVILDAGAVLDDRHLSLRRRTFAASADELRALVEPMLDLARRLERPNGHHPETVRGSAAAVRLRKAAHGGDEALRAEAIAFLRTFADPLGGGEVFAPSGERDVELRGRFRGHPFRLEVDSRLAPELTIKVPSAGETLYLEHDPDVDGQDARPPAWDEDEDAKLFVGPTTYVEGSRDALARVRAELDAMPEALRHALGHDLARHGVRYFRPDARQVWVMFWPTLDAMADPIASLRETLALMLAVAEHRAANPPPPRALDDEPDDEDDAG